MSMRSNLAADIELHCLYKEFPAFSCVINHKVLSSIGIWMHQKINNYKKYTVTKTPVSSMSNAAGGETDENLKESDFKSNSAQIPVCQYWSKAKRTYTTKPTNIQNGAIFSIATNHKKSNYRSHCQYNLNKIMLHFMYW